MYLKSHVRTRSVYTRVYLNINYLVYANDMAYIIHKHTRTINGHTDNANTYTYTYRRLDRQYASQPACGNGPHPSIIPRACAPKPINPVSELIVFTTIGARARARTIASPSRARAACHCAKLDTLLNCATQLYTTACAHTHSRTVRPLSLFLGCSQCGLANMHHATSSPWT